LVVVIVMPFGNVAVPAIQVTVTLPAPITMPIVWAVAPVIRVVPAVVPMIPMFVLAANPDASSA